MKRSDHQDILTLQPKDEFRYKCIFNSFNEKQQLKTKKQKEEEEEEALK
jgi:hypothetical protein